MDVGYRGLAVVIEPRASLAHTIADALKHRGYEVLVAASHRGAAALLQNHTRVDFLIAAIPAPDEEQRGAYLAEAREKTSGMGIVVMLSDPNESLDEAPAKAVPIFKPFSRDELEEAIERACSSNVLDHQSRQV